MSMNPLVFAPSETPPPSTLFVINRGAALYCGKVLTTGKLWGEDVILSSDKYRSQSVARAMTYLEVYSLGHDALMEVVSHFPLAYKRVRRSAALMALRRDMILKATIARMADGGFGQTSSMHSMLENASAESASFCKKAVRLDGSSASGVKSRPSEAGGPSKPLSRDACGSARSLVLSVGNEGSPSARSSSFDRDSVYQLVDLSGFAAISDPPSHESMGEEGGGGLPRDAATTLSVLRHGGAAGTSKGGTRRGTGGSVTFNMDGVLEATESSVGSAASVAAPTNNELTWLQAAVSAQQREISSIGGDVRQLVQTVGAMQAQLAQLLEAASWSTRE